MHQATKINLNKQIQSAKVASAEVVFDSVRKHDQAQHQTSLPLHSEKTLLPRLFGASSGDHLADGGGAKAIAKYM